MRKTFFTMLLGILTFGFVNAQTEIFNPATYNGELKDGMEVVDIDGTKYLQVVLNGWNSDIDIPEVTEVLGTQIAGRVKFAQGTPTTSDDLTLADISSVVQIMDTVNKVPASWNPDVLVPANTQLGQNPTLEGWSTRKNDITPEMKLVHKIQFYGQQTKTWGPTVGDTMWIGRLVSVDASILFDPASVDVSTLPDGMEVVEEGGEKLLKVKLNGWNSNLPITPFEVGKNNKMVYSVKYEAGDSGVENASAQSFIQAMGESGGLFSASINPAPADLTVDTVDAKPETVVTGLQFAAQETSGSWPAVVDAYLYVGKITVFFKDNELAEAPNTTTVAYSAEAKDITIDGLYDDAYGDVSNIINRVAVNNTGGDIAETNSYGEWLACADMDAFYIYLEVNDDDPIELGASTSPWMNDGVELFMDIQNRRYVGGSRIAGEQHQFRMNYGTEGPAHGDGGDGVSFGMDAFFGDNDTTNIDFAIISSSGGYVIEARIPWATWYRTNNNTSKDALDAISLSDGMKVAFEVSILDANALDARQSILNWANNTGEDVAYKSNEYWGEITLTGFPSAIGDKKEIAKLNVYPNPVNDQLFIDMNDINNVQVYNIIGSKVIDIELNGSNSVNVSELNNGVYIIMASDSNGNVAVSKFNKE